MHNKDTVVWVQSLVQELPYAASAALKRKKKNNKKLSLKAIGEFGSFFFPQHIHGVWKFLSHGSNPCHSATAVTMPDSPSASPQGNF